MKWLKPALRAVYGQRMRVVVSAFAVLGLACGGYRAELPDGGRGQVNCPGAQPSVPVRVDDPLGAPAPGATVTVVWLSYDEITLSYVTDSKGVAVVPSRFGPGTVRVKATLNDLVSSSAEIAFAGGECVSAVTPNNVVLQLE